MHDFEKFYRIPPDDVMDMDMMMFQGRLSALCGDTSAWASLQAAKRRDEKEAGSTLGAGPKVTQARDAEELDRQFAVVGAVLEAASGC